MENFSKEQTDEAKKIINLYVDLMESNNNALVYYLSDNVILDWFGKSIKEKKRVLSYIKEENVCKVSHLITNSFPVSGVAFKELHKVKVGSRKESSFIGCTSGEVYMTPIRQTVASTSHEMGQGDGFHNCVNMSPPKKMRITQAAPKDDCNTETVEDETDSSDQLKYVTAEGSIEFCKQSQKKLQKDVKWKRPFKLHLGYTSNSYKDSTIYLIIYEGNLKCRRNLFKEFCATNTKDPV